MPAKRKASAAADSGAPTPKVARPSKIAKENRISAQEEAEIKEAFNLFSEPMDGEKEGAIPIGDVRRAMIALGIPPTKPELAEFVSILDPDNEGFANYPNFVAICALKLHAREQDSDAHLAEVAEAFELFIRGGPAKDDEPIAQDAKIMLGHLKRVAMTLKEEVSDDLLRDMIVEANGGGSVSDGVARDEFALMMRRAGVWR